MIIQVTEYLSGWNDKIFKLTGLHKYSDYPLKCLNNI
jgi:hypothetical protein